MRISDWSSDVCSSDLPVMDRFRADRTAGFGGGHQSRSRYGAASTVTGAPGSTLMSATPPTAIAPLAAMPAVMYPSEDARRGAAPEAGARSEERRVGKECGRSGRFRWSPYI